MSKTATQEGAVQPMQQSGMAELLASRKAAAGQSSNDDDAAALAADEGTEADKQLAAQLGDSLDPSVYKNTTVRVKVDGTERDVSVADAVASYQIQAAAAQRMNEATQAKQEAERILAEARKQASSLSQGTAASTTAATTDVDINADLLAKRKAQGDALLEGDTELYAKLGMEIDELRGVSSQTAAPDVATIAAQVKQQITVDSAFNDFKTSYSDVVSNPLLYQLAVAKYHELAGSGVEMTQAFKDAGEHVRAEVRAMAAAQGMTLPDPKTADKQDKLSRKVAAAEIANVHSAGRTTTTSTLPRSREEVLAGMAAARGQSPPS